MNQASISIFKRSTLTNQHISRPFVPDELFQIAELVVSDKQTRIITALDAVYVIQYSETGPFKNKEDNWMPVFVYKLEQWSSGGITLGELNEYKTKSTENILSTNERTTNSE